VKKIIIVIRKRIALASNQSVSLPSAAWVTLFAQPTHLFLLYSFDRHYILYHCRWMIASCRIPRVIDQRPTSRNRPRACAYERTYGFTLVSLDCPNVIHDHSRLPAESGVPSSVCFDPTMRDFSCTYSLYFRDLPLRQPCFILLPALSLKKRE
jgi:hypothetical protein